MQVEVDAGGFAILPGALVVFFASLIVLLVLRSVGKRINERGGNDRQGIILDILVLLTAASMVASLSVFPLIRSIVKSSENWLSSNTGVNATATGLVLGVIIMALAAVYAKQEKWVWLLLFALSMLVAASVSSVVNDILSGWINGPVRWFWNVIVGFFVSILGLEINF